MRLLLTAACCLAATAAFAAPEIRIVNEAGLPEAKILAMQKSYGRWADRVYRYNHLSAPLPVNLVITRKVGIGYYLRPNIYLPPDDNPVEMLETFVHELAHHATGHDSSFFFKEGIASATTDALFAEDGRRVEGWPQYGVESDAWVNLFAQRGELPPLQSLVNKTGYDGSSRDAEFRSWQTYIIAASFLGWLIEHEGYDTFHHAFERETLGPKAAEWERRWLADIAARKLPPFDVVQALPQNPRYSYYADRLRS